MPGQLFHEKMVKFPIVRSLSPIQEASLSLPKSRSTSLESQSQSIGNLRIKYQFLDYNENIPPQSQPSTPKKYGVYWRKKCTLNFLLEII